MIETRLISNGKKVYLNEDNVEMIEPSNEFDTTKVYLVSGKAVIIDQSINVVRKQFKRSR